MIDRRDLMEFTWEVDDKLEEISDSAVLVNFSDALTALYPMLIKVEAHAYDSWDSIVEHLFFQMVYMTFAFKYGIEIFRDKCRQYEYPVDCIRKKFHIECVPKSYPLRVSVKGQEMNIMEDFLKDKLLVFISFGDGIHSFTGPSSLINVKEANFSMAEVAICSRESGKVIDDCSSVFVFKERIDYEFVAE